MTYKVFFSGLLILLGSALTTTSYAADSNQAVKRVNITYDIKPDLRPCPAPACGGWFITPVNILTLGLASEAEVLAAQANVAPNTTYISDLEFGCTQWTQEQIDEFKRASSQGSTLISGQVIERDLGKNAAGEKQTLSTFLLRDAYTAATKNAATGTYLNVQHSGIVCVTTPCPYFNADVLNSNLVYEFHELDFKKAGLTQEEELFARSQLLTGSLLVTGVSQPYQGQTGTGTSVGVTQVFWPYPPRKN